MKLFALAFLASAGVLITGCIQRGISGDGNIMTDKRAVAAFSAIDAVGGFDIGWSAGQPALTVMTDSNLLSHIKADVRDDTLHIQPDAQISPSSGIKVTIVSGSLTGAHLTGGIQLTAPQVSGKHLEIKGTGAVDIHVDGAVDDLDASLTGACHLKAASLKTKTAEIKLVGASDAEIAVSDALKVSAVGASSLKYTGKPKSIEQNVTGASSIGPMN